MVLLMVGALILAPDLYLVVFWYGIVAATVGYFMGYWQGRHE